MTKKKRTILTVGDRVREDATGLVGIVAGVSEGDIYELSAVGLSRIAWFNSDELTLLSEVDDESMEELQDMMDEDWEEIDE